MAAEITQAQQSSRSVKTDEGQEVGQLASESPVIMVRRREGFHGRVSARRLAAGDEMKSDGGNPTPQLLTCFHRESFGVELVLKLTRAEKMRRIQLKVCF